MQIEKLVYGGAGLARHGAETVFVPYVLPGERVEVELERRSSGVLRGAALAWEARSSERSDPPCPVFGRCGGCHYQHMPYERQRESKAAILRETLRRLGGVDWEGDIEVTSAEPWGYRNRTQLHFHRRDGAPSVGFLAPESHRHVAAEECAINCPDLNRLHGELREMTADRWFPKSLRSVEFFVADGQVQMNLPRRPGPLPRKFWSWCDERLGVSRPGAALECPCGPDVFRISGRSFFQVNRFLAARLADLALGDTGGQLALDLYCGVGLLTLPLARRFRNVVGVDSAESAVRDLRSNATRAGLALHAVHAGVPEFLRGYARRPDLIVADPPRAGLGKDTVREILRLRVPRVRLVSCDPATLARDLRQLAAGGYVVESLQLVDMFPQTYHIESIASLRLA